MSDTKSSGEAGSGSKRAGKTLNLKRVVETGQVRQNFSHGRSRSVLVEKKRARTIAPDGQGGDENLAANDAKTLSPKSPTKPDPAISSDKGPDKGPDKGKVEKLSESQKKARQIAVQNTKMQAAEEAEKRAQEASQPPSATKNKPPAPKQEESKKPHTPNLDRRGERRRRSGKLTINDALNDEERQRSLASIKRRREREKRQMGSPELAEKVSRTVVVPDTITIQELAGRMAERASDVIKILAQQEIDVVVTDIIDSDTAQLVAEELGHSVKRVSEADIEAGVIGDDDSEETKVARAPVATVMGHVDHGKTSLLDALRKSQIASREVGGITQHIGAYQLKVEKDKWVTFIDTPGHAAFSAMRARGVQATDLVVLVVAADDSVMPQTVEAIDHAKAGNVPIIVAINKIDKPEADVKRVQNDLLRHEVVSEAMGGDTQMIEISAKTGKGLDDMLAAILLQAESMNLKANVEREGEGIVIEAKLDKGRGAVATVLVKRGTIRLGDIFVVGKEFGRVRALVTDRGVQVKQAGPSTPVEVLGAGGTPNVGDMFNVVDSETKAREVAQYRARKAREADIYPHERASLDQMMQNLKSKNIQEMGFIVKTDVQGSAEAIAHAVSLLGNDDIRARVVSSGVGAITESDVTLALASSVPIIGFNVRANSKMRLIIEQSGVEIRYYSVIYDLVDDIKAAMTGMLAPELRENMIGNAEILEVFSIGKKSRAGGCRVSQGSVRRGAKVRLIRDDIVIHEGELSQLRRFKDEVNDVASGNECGMAFENYRDLKVGDIVECYEVEEITRTLDD